MTLRQDFDRQFQPETFSFKNSRDVEALYTFYLRKLTSRAIRTQLTPHVILTPHEFGIHISLDVTRDKQPGDFLATNIPDKLYLNLYDFLIYVSNPKQKISSERLSTADQKIYQNIFQSNIFVGELRPEDLERELDKIKKEFDNILSLRELQAKKWARLIEKMTNEVQARVRELFPDVIMYVEDQVLYVLIERISDLRQVELENVKIEGRNHVVFGVFDVNADIPEDLDYLRALVERYGEDLVKNVVYIDSYKNVLEGFEL